jgi:hypothetical protein
VNAPIINLLEAKSSKISIFWEKPKQQGLVTISGYEITVESNGVTTKTMFVSDALMNH